MARIVYATARRSRVASVLAGGLLVGLPIVAVAQQAVSPSANASRPISTEVALEYATIGAVQLSIPVLRMDGVGGSGQMASNNQSGSGNTTNISQTGLANRAAVQATGNGNTANLSQQGVGNGGQATLAGNGLRIDLQQVGNGNQAELNVTGANGGSLTLRQIGDGSNATLSAAGGRDVTVNQIGNGLSAEISQVGVPKSISVVQARTR